jgi:type II secretory pathway pseudopilin PulG
MSNPLANIVTRALRPLLTESLDRVGRSAAHLLVVAGCVVLGLVGVLALFAAGTLAMSSRIGTAPALAATAGMMLALSALIGVVSWRALATPSSPAARSAGKDDASASGVRAAEPSHPAPPRDAPAGSAAAKPDVAQPGGVVDSTFLAAACVTAAVILGPARLVRAARASVDMLRLAASLVAGTEIVRGLQDLASAVHHESERHRAPQQPHTTPDTAPR